MINFIQDFMKYKTWVNYDHFLKENFEVTTYAKVNLWKSFSWCSIIQQSLFSTTDYAYMYFLKEEIAKRCIYMYQTFT